MSPACTITEICPKCHSKTLAVSDHPTDRFCHKCQRLVADVQPRTRAERPQIVAGPRALQSVTFEFPLPTPGCTPNTRTHWRTESSAKRDYLLECTDLLPIVTAQYRFLKATISARFFLAPDPTRYHPRDVQNAIASIKQLVDAFVDTGWLQDDSARYLEWGRVELLTTVKEHKGRACVVVTLEAIS